MSTPVLTFRKAAARFSCQMSLSMSGGIRKLVFFRHFAWVFPRSVFFVASVWRSEEGFFFDITLKYIHTHMRTPLESLRSMNGWFCCLFLVAQSQIRRFYSISGSLVSPHVPSLIRISDCSFGLLQGFWAGVCERPPFPTPLLEDVGCPLLVGFGGGGS